MGNLTFDFRGRTVLVTGAARGVGRAIGESFGTAGATVYLVDNDAEAVMAAAAETGSTALAADVSETSQVTDVMERVVSGTGRIDVLVNNAGILRDGMVWKLTDEDYENVMAVHAGGTFRCTRAAVPHFRSQGGGRIINVTSYTGLRGNPGQSNYAMAKAADDLIHPAREARAADGRDPDGAVRRRIGNGRRRRVPGLGRGLVHHRGRAPGRRRDLALSGPAAIRAPCHTTSHTSSGEQRD